MLPRDGRPSQTWKDFLRNHADAVAAVDLISVFSITLERLYVFVALAHGLGAVQAPAVNRRKSKPRPFRLGRRKRAPGQVWCDERWATAIAPELPSRRMQTRAPLGVDCAHAASLFVRAGIPWH